MSRFAHRVRTAYMLAAMALIACSAGAQQRFSARGVVLQVDAAQKTLTVSADEIPGYAGAKVLRVAARDGEEIATLRLGSMIDFTLVADGTQALAAEAIRLHTYQGLAPDPLTARRLKLLDQAVNPAAVKPVALDSTVPDFTLVDQARRRVSLSDFRGKVVALNFVYTRCALPNFCLRMSNHFGEVQKRFRNQLGRELVLLTVTFDPAHDSPEVLAKYATTWNANPRTWHFLTGAPDAVHRVCDLFGEDYFQDEGLMNHSLRTAVIDRDGKLAASLEGNEFSAQQLGDVIAQVVGTQK